MSNRRERRSTAAEFKLQMVKLYESRKPRGEIIRKYELSSTAFDRWIKQSESSGSFKEKNNRSPEENELIRLRKEYQQLKMENDILKQVADHRTKSRVIWRNTHNYSVSALCKVLNMNRSVYYYVAQWGEGVVQEDLIEKKYPDFQ